MKHTVIVTALVVLLFVGAYPAKPLKFHIRMMADGLDEAAMEAGFRTLHLAFTSFVASDGEAAWVTSAYFETADEAERYFEWKIGRAEKVTKQATETDRAGKRVGRRAIVMDSGSWEVMWTDGSGFRSISSNQAVVLELERQHRHPTSPKRVILSR